MPESMATMVTKPCKHKPSAPAAHPNASILLPSSTQNGVADGAISTTVNGFSPINLEGVYELDDGEWTLLSDSNNAEDYVGVQLGISEDEIINFNSSNNNKVRTGRTKIIVRNSRQAQSNSKDHVSTSLPRNHKLKPMKNNLDRDSVNSIKTKTVNDQGLSDNADCGKDFNKALYPEIANVQIGATEFMSALGMRPLVCPFGYMEHKSGPELSLSFVLSLSCLISTNFSWRSKQTQNCNEYLFQILEKHQLTFRLRFPYQGLYTLEIHAQKKSASDLPKNVFNYIINAPNPVVENILPFPTTHKDWHVAGYLLKEPLDGVLPSNSQSAVGVRVLRAVSVFITSGGTSVDLKEHEGSWWIGLFNTGVAGSEIGLHAVFPAEPHSSVPLLSFRVAPTTVEGNTTVDISAFEEEIVAIERKRLQQLLNSNRDWLKKILAEEENYSKDTISAHKARLLRLSQQQTTHRKTEHTKQRRKLKPNQPKKNLADLFSQEQKVLGDLRKDCRQRFADIRNVESETIAIIETGGKNAIEEIKKSLSSLLKGMNIPQEEVSERLKNHMKLLAELDGIQAELFSKNTWMEDSLGEIANVHKKLVSAVADLQRSTFASLGLAVGELKEEDEEVVDVVSVIRELSEREILDRLENMEQEALNEMTDEAKAYVDGTGEMKHESIKQIYSLQIKEMQLQDAWIKAREMRIFELLQISTPASDIAKFLQTEIDEATNDCKKRLLALRNEVTQQSQYLQDVYKESLFKFQLSEQEKLKEYERKLETTLAASCGTANENLLQQHSAKPREIVLRLEGHLAALVAEIGVRDVSTFLTIRDAIASNVFAELDQAQADMLQNTARVVSVDTSGKQVVKTDIMKDVDPVKTESWKHASKVLLSDLDTTKTKRKTSRSDSLPRKPRKMSDNQELLRLLSAAQESKLVEENVDDKSLQSDETSLSDASRCSFLILGRSEDCKDSVLKLIEESAEQLKQTTNRTDDLTTNQRLMTKAVLQIEDMLTAETKDILTYIIKEVYDHYKETMAALKKSEEDRLLQVRRVKRDSMFEMKDWLKNRFKMMVAHDTKTTGKLKIEISSMIDEMERLGYRRVMCIKAAFDNNKTKIKNYEEQAKSRGENEEFHGAGVVGHIKTMYNETVSELESKVKSCYRSIKEKALSEFENIEIDEQIKSNECKERVLERFWGNVRDGERDVVNELQLYCISKEREEAEVAHDCINGEEETMDLIKTDLMKKCSDIDRSESRIRTESGKVEEKRLDEIEGLVKDSPWLWSEVKKEEDERLLEKRIYDEERLFELESKQEEALTSLMASREMSNSQVENKFREKHARLRKEFLTKGSDYVADVFLTGKVRNIQEKILGEIQKIHKDMVMHIRMNDHRIFRDMKIELNRTFERISTDYQKMYHSVTEMQNEIYAPIRTLEEQIRASNRVELDEGDVWIVKKEMKENLFKVLELREKSHLRGWLDTVSSNGLDDELRQEVISVDMIVKSLDRIDELRNEAMSLDIRKMRKVLTKFQSPNHTIHEALKGILLALGDHEGVTGEWKNCMRRITPIGRTKLKWRVKKFILTDLDPRVAKRAMDILNDVPFDQVDEISPEVMTYCSWAWAVCEERLEMATFGGHRTPDPANLHEQIQIFKRKYHCKGPVAGPRVLLFDTDHSLNRNADQMLESRKNQTFEYKNKLSDVSDGRYYKDY